MSGRKRSAELPGFLRYVRYLMNESEKRKTKNLLKKYSKNLAQSWNNLDKQKKEKYIQESREKGNKLLLPRGWSDRSTKRKGKSWSDMLWIDCENNKMNSGIKVWNWFFADEATGMPKKISSSKSFTTTNTTTTTTTTTSTSVQLSTTQPISMATISKVWPNITVFCEAFKFNGNTSLGIRIQYIKKLNDLNQDVGKVYVEELESGSIIEKIMDYRKTVKKKSTFVLKQGDQLVGIANHLILPNQGTQRVKYELNKARYGKKSSSIEFYFGRPNNTTYDVPELLIGDKKKNSKRKNTSISTSLSTSSSSSSSSTMNINSNIIFQNNIRSKSSDSIYSYFQKYSTISNQEHISSNLMNIMNHLGVEIVSDLCLLKYHHLMEQTKRSMIELIGNDNANFGICWSILLHCIDNACIEHSSIEDDTDNNNQAKNKKQKIQ
jgi:hypothetical protein